MKTQNQTRNGERITKYQALLIISKACDTRAVLAATLTAISVNKEWSFKLRTVEFRVEFRVE